MQKIKWQDTCTALNQLGLKRFSANSDNCIEISKCRVPIVCCETRKGLCEDTYEWLDRILGTGKWATKLKIAGAQTLFFFSDIINWGWVVASAKKNDYKFLPVCSSWRCQLKQRLPRLVPAQTSTQRRRWDTLKAKVSFSPPSASCWSGFLFGRRKAFSEHPPPGTPQLTRFLQSSLYFTGSLHQVPKLDMLLQPWSSQKRLFIPQDSQNMNSRWDQR